MKKFYPDADPKQNFPEVEEEILSYWSGENIFLQSLQKNQHKGNADYIFYDGPPFANGLPHYGHLLTGYVKDLVPRYQTMKGKYVDRRFGWDCHGLPAEMDAQKNLDISGRANIIEFGIEKFNNYCETAIMKYTGEWEEYVHRQARWVDFTRAYRTMDKDFMESVMWAFAELWKKGLLYEGYRVMPYSWALETPLSNFETRLDNAYRERQDPAISVLFDLEPLDMEELPLKIIAWTTTPWTLPSNLALAVGPDIEYLVIEKDQVQYIIGRQAFEKYKAQFDGARHIKTITGKELENRKYKPLFPYFGHLSNAFRILSGKFVDVTEGTGVVHMAPGFGEDDQILCAHHNILPVCPVDSQGRFTSEAPDFAGMLVFDANATIIKFLKSNNAIVKHETIVHNYPHCWRTDTPLIFKVQSSWYVKVTEFKDRMCELNKQINWIPEHIRDGMFGNWLEGAKDWSISRNRFWGTPLPIWKSDDPQYPRIDVYGSIERIEKDFGVHITDLHRQHLDALTRPNPDDPTGQSRMRRVDDVLDCWFESGSMSFAQVHYPFENRELFQRNFPADFIVEYQAQTRGWFYTMLVLSTALFDKPPFKNAICHGVILDEKGDKLSKSKRNYPDPEEIFQLHGSDTLRWYLMSSQLMRGGDLQIDKEGKAIAETSRKIIIPLWNAYCFFCLYANSDGIKAKFQTDSPNILDKYILSKTAELVKEVTASLDEYNIPKASHYFENYIHILNNWYIRRSRDRFWKTDHDDDKTDVYNVLFTVLTVFCRTAAPFLPLITEKIYRGLTGRVSVHLEDWPSLNELSYDSSLVSEMDLIIEICSTALSIRKRQNIKVRQPLNALTVCTPNAATLAKYSHIISNEVNVKRVFFTEEIEGWAKQEIAIDYKKAGPVLGKQLKHVVAAIKGNVYNTDAHGNILIDGMVIPAEFFDKKLIVIDENASKATSLFNGVVTLNLQITQMLKEEGIVRDFVRSVQQCRKQMGLKMSDRICIYLSGKADTVNALLKHIEYIKAQTCSESIEYNSCPDKKEWVGIEDMDKDDLCFNVVLQNCVQQNIDT